MLKIITSKKGHPCLVFTNAFCTIYGTKAIGKFLFGDIDRLEQAKQAVQNYYQEPYKTQALEDLSISEENVVHELIHEICVNKSKDSCNYLCEYVYPIIKDKELVTKISMEIESKSEEPYWMLFFDNLESFVDYRCFDTLLELFSDDLR